MRLLSWQSLVSSLDENNGIEISPVVRGNGTRFLNAKWVAKNPWANAFYDKEMWEIEGECQRALSPHGIDYIQNMHIM